MRSPHKIPYMEIFVNTIRKSELDAPSQNWHSYDLVQMH